MVAWLATCRTQELFLSIKTFEKNYRFLWTEGKRKLMQENFKAHTSGFRQFISRPQSNTRGYKLLNYLGF